MSTEDDWRREDLKKDIESMTAITVPVNMVIRSKQRILDLSEVEKVLKGASLIALGRCYCKEKLKRCDSPVDVCLRLDENAEESIKKGSSKRVDLEEASMTLKKSHEAGLVHIVYTSEGDEKPNMICSCCSCCCWSMSALVRFGMPDAIVESKYVAVNDSEACINCGTCVERCQFGAISVDDEVAEVNRDFCMGCGLCVSSCSTGALTLTRKSDDQIIQPPSDLGAMFGQIGKEKGRKVKVFVD